MGNLTIKNLRIANGEFSGIYNRGTTTVINSTITDNNNVFGGGIRNTGALTVINSTVSGNRATTAGGGIYNTGSVTITNSTIAANGPLNSGPISGGGVHNQSGVVTAGNTIIWGNSANIGFDYRGTLTSQGFNLIGSTNATDIVGDPTGNILDRDAQLDPLADNGGATKTHRLRFNSPAIDKGTRFDSTTDQRGLTRPFDIASVPDAPGGDGSDIGAFETSLAPTAAGVTVSGRVMTPDGRGLINAVVTLTDQQGNARSTRTSSFGYFRFSDIAAGETVVISIASKRYTFTPRVVTVNDEISDLNFVAEP